MKRLALLLSFLFIFGLLTATQITNLRATAISHDGFTARWDALSGTETYFLEAMQGTEQSIDFEGSNQFPSGWSSSSALIHNSVSYAHSGSYSAVINRAGGYICLPLINNPGSLSFFGRAAASLASFTAKVQISADAESWTDLLTLQAISGELGNIVTAYQHYGLDVNLMGQYYLRFFLPSISAGSFIFDDLQYTELFSAEPIRHASTAQTALRLGGLTAETGYIFRVKPLAEASDYSAWKGLQTTEYHSNSSTGSAIADQAASIFVSADNGSSSQVIQISPVLPGIYDYSVQAQLLESILEYSISSEISFALNAHFEIHHPTYTVIGCTASNGQISDFSSSNGISSFDLSGFGEKSGVTLYLETVETLAVMLSSFSVHPLAAGKCRLSWSSSSESQLLGYHVLRSCTSDLSSCSVISPLILAQNSSQPVKYVFTDDAAILPAHYWLSALSYDGTEEFFGPVFLDMPDVVDSSGAPALNAVKVYPNPVGISGTLHLCLSKSQSLSYKIYNSRGQWVHSASLGDCPEGEFQRSLLIGHTLPSGVYILVLEGKELLLRERFVIQN